MLLAQGIVNPALGTMGSDASAGKLGLFIAIIMRAFFILAGIFCLWYILWGAFDWIMSRGEKDALERARDKMTHAIIGLALMAAFIAIISFISSFLQIDLLNLVIPTI